MKLLISALVLVAAAADAQTLQPAGWDKNAKLPEAVDTNPDPAIVEIALEARVAPLEIAPGRADRRLDIQRRASRAADSRSTWRPRHRAFHQPASRVVDRPLARRAGADRDGRRAGRITSAGRARRIVHLRLHRPGRRVVLVSPSRHVGCAGGIWPIRSAAGG